MRRSNDIEILCTLGPSSLNRRIIKRLEEVGVSIFRINLSHTRQEDVEKTILETKSYTSIPVCLDTEGPQVRSGLIQNNSVFLKENGIVTLTEKKIVGDSSNISIRPKEVFSKLVVGDLISIDFDSALLCVTEIIGNDVVTKVVCEGWVGSNKAVTIDKDIELPVLSEKDKYGIELSRKYGLDNISLSFVSCKGDIDIVRKLTGRRMRIISKVETNKALLNLDEILKATDVVLIDRGDLSREEPINKIPLLQKTIIKASNEKMTPVFVATNLLESMVNSKKPLRSEVNDIMNTLLDGADGLVLAAETAIGNYPVECANMVKRMTKYYQIATRGYSLPELLKNDSFLLIEPHGGDLVDRYNENLDVKSLEELPKVTVDSKDLMDMEQIAIGTYSPLEGFMTREELNAVLDNHRLPNDIVWTLPIVLQVSEEESRRFSKNDDIVLVYEGDGEIYGTMHVRDKYATDMNKVAEKWFGSTDITHPGVKHFYGKGNSFIGGEIKLIRKRNSDYKEFELTPRQTRIIFEHKEWSKVAGFHTRNPVHKAHQYLQSEALIRHDLDGLFLHPVIGPKKPHDFKPYIILESYKILWNDFYPKNKVVLGAFSTYSRYAGPREAVFTALCRKNFGCSHFIMGRDHTGVGNYYGADVMRELFDSLGELGINPIFFNKVYYCRKCKDYVEECRHEKEAAMHISGTEVRKMFMSGECPPEWFMDKNISSMVLERIKMGEEVFVK